MSQFGYQKIADAVLEKIASGMLKRGDKLPTELELCEQYGVSRITVQKAMKQLSEQRIIYRISGKGTFVGEAPAAVLGEKRLIGLVLCSFSAAFGMDIIRAVEKTADKLGFSVILKNSYFDVNKEKEIISLLLRLNVAGIKIQPVHDELYNPELIKLTLGGFPIVTLDREINGFSIPFIGSDNYRSAEIATKFLLDKGHRNICMFVGHMHNTSSLRERMDGFKRQCAQYGVVADESSFFTEIYSTQMGNVTQADVRADIERVKDFLQKRPDITCAFASEYAISRIIRSSCRELGKRIPEDFSIITFDNHNDIFRRNQTTYMRQRQDLIGESSVEAIYKLLRGESVPRSKLFDAEIIDNGSVADCR